MRVGDLIFVSGQASVDATGKIVADTFEGEFRRSVENLRKVLETAGSDLKHVIQTRNYVRDAANVPRYNELYREYFSAPFPDAYDHHQLPSADTALRDRVRCRGQSISSYLHENRSLS